MLMELLFFLSFYFGRKPQGDLSASFCWQDLEMIKKFGKMFVARIALSHAFKKIYKNVTERLTSNSVLAQIFLAVWTLNPGAASSCSAVWIHDFSHLYCFSTNLSVFFLTITSHKQEKMISSSPCCYLNWGDEKTLNLKAWNYALYQN